LSGPRRLRVFVVSDVRVYREGIARLVATEDDLELAGAASIADSSPRADGRARADVILVDATRRPDLMVARGVALAAGAACLVVLVAPDQDIDLSDWAGAGVSGFLSTEASVLQLVRVLSRAARGESPCSPDLADAFLRRAREGRDADGGFAGALTGREAQIAELVADGLSNKAIASRLSIEPTTVKNHVHSVLGKLRVHSRGEAAAKLRGREQAQGPGVG
jgi:two-component system, NarL family, nitrate/nitrite response regulator NarL